MIRWFTEHGVVDTSMRTLATGIGTSNRMLNYHFGSREDLLTAVIEQVCASEELAIRDYLAESPDPFVAGAAYWQHAAATADTFAPLFYELAAHAMYGKLYAQRLQQILTESWLAAFTEGFARVTDGQQALRLAHLSLAVGRGVLFELALTGDRATADATIAAFTAMTREAIDLPTTVGGDLPR
ncbi:MAG: TetR/AcrR family transcriptional regulator [Nakamurella sp.]